jgi:AraC-like DNA-binding protein
MPSTLYMHPSPASLCQWVDKIWISKGKSDSQKLTVLPNGSIDVVINFGSCMMLLEPDAVTIKEIYKNFWISGFQHAPTIVHFESDISLLGIRFLPGGAYPFLKFPVDIASDKVITPYRLAYELNELRGVIKDLSDHHRVFTLVESFLLKNFHSEFRLNETVKYVIDQLHVSPQGNAINKLINKTGYSRKHFLCLFKKEVGTTPKSLQRILRFKKIIQALKNCESIKWIDLIYEYSFYDSSHFINDFKKISGMTPRQYLKSYALKEINM